MNILRRLTFYCSLTCVSIVTLAFGRGFLPQTPYVKSDRQGTVDGCSNDELMHPCYGRDIEVVNPRKRAVRVRFDCGLEYLSSPVFEIPGSSGLLVKIESDVPGNMEEDRCKIIGWKEYR